MVEILPSARSHEQKDGAKTAVAFVCSSTFVIFSSFLAFSLRFVIVDSCFCRSILCSFSFCSSCVFSLNACQVAAGANQEMLCRTSKSNSRRHLNIRAEHVVEAFSSQTRTCVLHTFGGVGTLSVLVSMRSPVW